MLMVYYIGGISDTTAVAWIINKLCAVGPPTFVRKLEIAAKKGVTAEQVRVEDEEAVPVVASYRDKDETIRRSLHEWKRELSSMSRRAAIPSGWRMKF
jgi:hypothetical protein